MKRDPLDEMRLTPAPQAPDAEFERRLERQVRRAIETMLETGGGEPMAQTATQTLTQPLNRHGHVSYVEIPAQDAAVSAEFYEQVFGWMIRGKDPGRSAFTDPNGDLIGALDAGMPIASDATVLLYMSVDDVATTVRRIAEAGGQIVREPYPEGPLTVATFRDPAGNVLGVWQMPEAPSFTPSLAVSLNCIDAKAEIQWLTDVLGLRLTALFEEEDGRVAYSQLVWESGGVNVSSRSDSPGRLPATGPSSIVITLEDEAAVDAALERARQAGAEVLLPIERAHYGGYGFTLRDPEGNLWNVGRPFLDTPEARNLPQRRL